VYLSGDVLSIIEEDFAGTYELFDRTITYIPTRTVCTHCGGVDSIGEPIDTTCQYCDDGYTWAWTIQELDARVEDIALVSQIFVSITPGIQVGDKLLVMSEADSDLVKAVLDNVDAYLEAGGSRWRPKSVQPSQVGRSKEWVAHLIKFSPEVAYGS